MLDFLNELEDLLAQRRADMPDGSYTTSLFKEGADRILRKVGEESGELIIAGKNQDRDEILNESADLLFHLMVFLRSEGLSLSEVVEVLRSRHSG